VFTYVLESIIKRRSGVSGADRTMDMMEKHYYPWLFGLEPSNVSSFRKPISLNLIEDIGSSDYQARYLKPMGRNLVVSEVERIVQAIVIRS
jgi:O-methyltransferase involved in polyketide biosynthesis